MLSRGNTILHCCAMHERADMYKYLVEKHKVRSALRTIHCAPLTTHFSPHTTHYVRLTAAGGALDP